MRNDRGVVAALGLAVVLLLPGATARAATDEMGFVRIQQGEEVWKNPFGVGVEVATLYGDPSKPGIYVLRIKWPPGIMSKPHKHPEDRHVVVLSGAWYTGTGDVFEPAKAIPMRTGGYMVHPAGAVHWDGTREEGAVIQITGYGPSGNNFVKPDEPQFGKTN
ncbi:cupin domain-containing protein [Tardiphaga sp.]|uniref:cupin domain-containing protein n=1 Tax=Tardiphaga sp. TaxID=1926292 RepID=UPI0019BB1221|nr:cupin domain-containing protein [Tardiphaga sp.]MBC7578115.1 cupin domain-containing protein [Tardiphaga sp.]